ncbi:MAG TPA: RdgB/HAM1 family non-canonical purine NTP pyrophosphatase [Euzebyales bacterium]|nr:RdgB/HAM1 family non-canonical purine NTP pyrophosphatase [Euzebyales bacterium]
MITVVLATHNAHKVTELRRILDGLPIRLVSGQELDLPDVEETGETFADNALLKARACAAATGLPAVADDSGLVVDALGGEPGVRSARYAGGHGDDQANLRLVLERLGSSGDRTGRFVCVAALVVPDGHEVTETGTMEGVITHEPRGDGGFGYDPIFVATGQRRTNAELAPQDKDAISHRGAAFRALRPHLVALVDPVGGVAGRETSVT